ncbi:MAG: hypothetical protein CMK00_06780 [Planctomycetes bacterium]|nr:hypothetical protein [Planctomycetota bacterium]
MLTWVFRHRSRLGRIYGSPALAAPDDSRAFGEGLDLPGGHAPEQASAESTAGPAATHPQAGHVQRRSRWVLLRPMMRPRRPDGTGEDGRAVG